MRYLEMFILTDSSLAYPNTPIKVVPQRKPALPCINDPVV